MRTNRVLMMLAACGTAAAFTSGANGQTVINLSGATLLENFFRAPASTNDYIDANGNCMARVYGSGVEQLAPGVLPPTPATDHWAVQYRSVGSVNGFQELVNYGQTFVTGDHDDAPLCFCVATSAYYNRIQYIATGAATGPYNQGNPGGAPVRSDMTTLIATYEMPQTPSAGGLRVDMAPVDVPATWAVRQAGVPVYSANPTEEGYGSNPRRSVNKAGGSAGADLDSLLADLGPLNLFDPNLASSANENTIFDTSIAFAPIATLTNFGTGLTQIDATDLQHLVTTGRRVTGENLVMVTRDVGSGTRNGWTNSIGIDPSFGVGENIGALSTQSGLNLIGPDFQPSNKGGSSGLEATVQNHRLAIGYSGAERGVESGWLTGGRIELLAVRNDHISGTDYSRPTIDDVLDNDANGYMIGGPAVFATIGFPGSAPENKGGLGWAEPFCDANFNGIYDAGETFADLNNDTVWSQTETRPADIDLLPSMRNVEAAAYINNITRSVLAFAGDPGAIETVFTPGEWLATRLILTAATDNVQNPLDPTDLIENPNFNSTLQDFTRNNPTSVLRNPAYASFGVASLNGKVPTRKTGVTFTDGNTGTHYVLQSGTTIGYTQNMPMRNRIAGDFDGNGVRNVNDTAEMILAWGQRNGGPAWVAPIGTGLIAGAPSGDASIEMLGDFNGDGNFTSADARYFADGLATSTGSGQVDRRAGFTAVDAAFGGNFFGTTLAHGTYNNGDSRADVAGGAGFTPGFAPIGQDGAVNAADLDYIYGQFRRNANVTDGQLNWSNLAEAINADLSADMNGDLVINQADIDEVLAILETTGGDVNLDGVCDDADAAIAQGNIDMPGGWAMGDVSGDGTVTQADLDLIDDCIGGDCPVDFSGDGLVGSSDITAFLQVWFADIAGGTTNADFNNSGGTGSADITAFLSAWFAALGTGC
ncbi:MAG: hypothetical protein H7Y88_02350 [Phycisphaerales bacterium]|nr:hypothetical protein [Phycisphaerales bacterium]